MGRKELSRRGIFLLPSLFTLGNLFCGFYALLEASRGRFGAGAAEDHFARAAAFIALSMLLDGLDGRIARLAHATSPMGVQLDSLADVVAFGVAPAFLAHCWALQGLGRIGMAAAFLFIGCGALRLARFNVQAASHPDHRYFVGLPIPGAAAGIAALVHAAPAAVGERATQAVVGAWIVLLSLFMVSTIRYRSLKEFEMLRRRPVRALVYALLAIAVLLAASEIALAGLALGYALHGPALRLWSLVARRGGEPAPAAGRPADEAR